jgi:hypothetical protein
MSFSSVPPWQSFKELFAIDYVEVEKMVENQEELYPGLHPEALYTSLEDFYHLMSLPFLLGDWVDLGGGIGESALLYASLFSERKAYSLEKSKSRVKAGLDIKRRLHLSNAFLLEADLFSCDLPNGEIYFLYFPTGPVLDRLLVELRKKSRFKYLIAVESHGNLIPRILKESFLNFKSSVPLVSQRHLPDAYIFERGEEKEKFSLHHLSFLKRFLRIRSTNNIEWIGESFGLEWLKDDHYQLLSPPRTIRESEVREILEWENLSPEIQFLLQLQKLGEVQLIGIHRQFEGFIRKVILSPSFMLEISSGEWIKWEEIKFIKWKNHLCYDLLQGFYSLPHVP